MLQRYKHILIGLGILGIFFSGFYVGYIKSDREFKQFKLKLSNETIKQGKDYEKKLAEVISERDSFRVRYDDVVSRNRSLSDRLRKSTDSGSKTGAADTSDSERSKCRKLLSRGAELAQRGCELYGKCAIDKDSLAKLIR